LRQKKSLLQHKVEGIYALNTELTQNYRTAKNCLPVIKYVAQDQKVG